MSDYKFPPNPSNGDEILDPYGERYRYDAHSKSWIQLGIVNAPPTATYSKNGLVSPQLAVKLNQIQSLGTARFSLTKPFVPPVPKERPYFLFLRSSDHLVKFSIDQI